MTVIQPPDFGERFEKGLRQKRQLPRVLGFLTYEMSFQESLADVRSALEEAKTMTRQSNVLRDSPMVLKRLRTDSPVSTTNSLPSVLPPSACSNAALQQHVMNAVDRLGTYLCAWAKLRGLGAAEAFPVGSDRYIAAVDGSGGRNDDSRVFVA